MYDDKLKRQIELWDETTAWIADNPEAYARFVELAMEKVARQEEFSIGALTEVVRWDASIRFKKRDFAIPNALRRYIAIYMMEQHPEIEPWCTTKRREVEVPRQLVGKLKKDIVADPAIDDLFETSELREQLQAEGASDPAPPQPESTTATSDDEIDRILASVPIAKPSDRPPLVSEEDFEALFRGR